MFRRKSRFYEESNDQFFVEKLNVNAEGISEIAEQLGKLDKAPLSPYCIIVSKEYTGLNRMRIILEYHREWHRFILISNASVQF